MRRFYTFLGILLLAVLTVQSQDIAVERLYQKYRGCEGVVSIWVPGVAARLAANIADLEGPEAELLRSIRSVRVLTIDEPDLYPGANFTKEVDINPDKGHYQLMVRVSDGNEDVMILGREKRGVLKDLLVLVGGEENVMVHIKGRVQADMIGALAQVAGGDKFDVLSSL